jgi:hypothetical protein
VLQFYIKLLKPGAPETPPIEKIDSRAHATEFVYSEAAYFAGVAEQRWPELKWRVEAARTARYVIKSGPKRTGGV